MCQTVFPFTEKKNQGSPERSLAQVGAGDDDSRNHICHSWGQCSLLNERPHVQVILITEGFKDKHTLSPLHFISLTQLPVSQWSQAFIIQRKAFDQPYPRNPNIPSVFIEIIRKLLEMHPDNDEKYYRTHIFPLWKIKQLQRLLPGRGRNNTPSTPFSLPFFLSTGEKRENKSAYL